MDQTTAVVVIIVMFALIATVSFVVYRRRTRVRISRQGFELDGDNTPPPAAPGVIVEGSEAGRDLRAHDRTGRGTRVSQSKAVRGNIEASSAPPVRDPKG